MRLGIIVTTFDNLPMLKTLIKQIKKYTHIDYRLYVIDNGQKKDTKTWLKRQKNLTAVFNKENIGVAGSWNVGLDLCEKNNCTHFAVFNDDIELPPDWWIPCQKAFEGADLVFLDHPSPILLTGWFFIFTRNVLNRLGRFDEQFTPFFCEDMDFWIRFKRMGLRYAQVSIKVFHAGSATLKKVKKERADYYTKIWNENWVKLRKKYPNVRMQDQSI